MGTRRASGALGLAAAGAAVYLGWRTLQRRSEMELRGRVVAITGGSRGLGLVLARQLAREGCRLAICARDEQELRVAGGELTSIGAEVLALRCDISEREQVEEWVQRVQAELGPIDVLINNAGIIQVGPLETMTPDDFERALAINFLGAVYTTLAVLPEMRARGGGRIVNITSIGGKVAVPHLLPYDSAKFAMVGFSEGLRSELSKEGISVTTVVPGLMRTGSPPNALFKGNQDAEYTWFSLGDATPLTAMDARRAAARIIEAMRRGEAEVVLTWQAKLLRVVHDLFPGATAEALGWVNRLLPEADGPTGARPGMELATPLSPSPLTAMMNEAARRNNEYAGRRTPSPEHAAQAGITNDDQS